MDFSKFKKLAIGKMKALGGGGLQAGEHGSVFQSDYMRDGSDDPAPEVAGAAAATVAEEEEDDVDEDDDDDFITNEVKRRLKDLRKNAFMVLIPEECADEEIAEEECEEEGSSSREWIGSDLGAGEGYPWCSFGTFYGKYSERMLFFDKIAAQIFKESGSLDSKHSPKSHSKLASSFLSLSFKKRDGLKEDQELLREQQHLPQQEGSCKTIETVYVAQVSLSWEALHSQYMQLQLLIAAQPESPRPHNCAAQSFQQFQVLLQRFIETEPFEQGSRPEIYARCRSSLPKLLQVPNFQVPDQTSYEADDMDSPILAAGLVKLLEESILTYQAFLKNDKRSSGGGALNGSHNQKGSSLLQVQSSLDKKEMKVKELLKKRKGRKGGNGWPTAIEEVQLLFALIDIKVVSRVLRMPKLSKEQLLWCEEKMSKLDLSDKQLRRDTTPILFPC